MTNQDWASWLSAIGTVGAFAISLLLLGYQMRDRRRDQEDKKAEQAKHVSAWCNVCSEPPEIWVQNLGFEPIYHLVVRVGSADVDFKLPPYTGNSYTEYVWGNIAPQSKEKLATNAELIKGKHFPDMPSIQIEFTDVQGQFWRRDKMGKLEKITFRRPYD